MSSPAKNFETSLDLTIEEVVFRSEDGRFSVVGGTRADKEEKATVIGDLGHVTPGETLRVRGRWQQHAVYGERFSVSSFTPITPTTSAGIARYLGSGLVPGIGPALAERLVSRFGADTLDVISTQSARLREVSGIGAQRAHAIADAVRSKKLEAEVLSFLHALGIGPALANRIRHKYGADVVRIVRDDPYLVAEEVAGVGFKTADRIGIELGYALDDPRRAAGAVLHLVAKAADDGHVYTESSELLDQADSLNVPRERAEAAVAELVGRGMLIEDGRRIYAPPLFHAETRVARALTRLSAPCPEIAGAATVIERLRTSDLAVLQLEAVRMSLRTRLLVLTGGPGTGKTTTTRAIVDAHRALGRRVVLCAPTGRAAKRLSEATASDAQTIHRLLEYNPATNQWQRNQNAPLEADTVLVDEASMVDVLLAEHLLSAVPETATLILVGDADQLPPVSAGAVLRDVLDSGRCPVVRLTEIFRQAQASAIVRAAHAIQRGEMPTPSPSLNKSDRTTPIRPAGDLFIIRAREPDAIADRLSDVLRRMSQTYGLDSRRDIQVITPMRRGPLGTDRLNQWLQEELNPAHGDSSARTGFRVGDKVMQLRNDYDREVFNGDMGIVSKIDAGVVFVDMGGRSVAYQRDDLPELSLAYASTVHKVQGSEFPAVVIVLHGAHHVLLSRPLVYTAITRARGIAVLVGDERALQRAIDNTSGTLTRSGLRERLLEGYLPSAASTPS